MRVGWISAVSWLAASAGPAVCRHACQAWYIFLWGMLLPYKSNSIQYFVMVCKNYTNLYCILSYTVTVNSYLRTIEICCFLYKATKDIKFMYSIYCVFKVWNVQLCTEHKGQAVLQN